MNVKFENLLEIEKFLKLNPEKISLLLSKQLCNLPVNEEDFNELVRKNKKLVKRVI